MTTQTCPVMGHTSVQGNLASLNFWDNGDVHAEFARLREEAPISWHEHPDSGKGFWSFARHSDIAALNDRADLLSNSEGIRVNHDKEMNLVRPGSDSMIEADPPHHTGMRSLVSKAFTPRASKRMEESIRERSKQLIADFAPAGKCEFVSQAAALLPLHVICDIVGVPEADREYVFDLTNRSLGENDPELSSGPEYGSKASEELKAYGQQLGERRMREPKDDLVTKLVDAGNGLSPKAMGGFFSLLIAAGNETTRNALSFGLDGFSKFPEQREIFMNQPEFADSAAEEVVRWASPLMNMRRTAAQDFTYKGIDIRKGEKVVFWYISANRDESVFKDPFHFDITRNPNPHQAFGAGGPHFCLGSNLAKLEIKVFFQELFSALPDIHSIGEPNQMRSNQFRGVSRLDAEFTSIK